MTNSQQRTMPVPPAIPVMKYISHGSHLFITIITCGFWAPFWFICTAGTNNQNKAAQRKYALKYAEYQQKLDEYRGL